MDIIWRGKRSRGSVANHTVQGKQLLLISSYKSAPASVASEVAERNVVVVVVVFVGYAVEY